LLLNINILLLLWSKIPQNVKRIKNVHYNIVIIIIIAHSSWRTCSNTGIIHYRYTILTTRQGERERVIDESRYPRLYVSNKNVMCNKILYTVNNITLGRILRFLCTTHAVLNVMPRMVVRINWIWKWFVFYIQIAGPHVRNAYTSLYVIYYV